MYKTLLFMLVAAISPGKRLAAQQSSNATVQKNTRFILATGISLQTDAAFPHSINFSAEYRIAKSLHVGCQYSSSIRNDSRDNNSGLTEDQTGNEFSVFVKFFTRQKSSGPIPGFFIGPDIRYGRFHYQDCLSYYDPSVFIPDCIDVDIASVKFLARPGMQWLFGKHSALEISMPVGYVLRTIDLGYPNSNPLNQSQFTIIPTLAMGVAW